MAPRQVPDLLLRRPGLLLDLPLLLLQALVPNPSGTVAGIAGGNAERVVFVLTSVEKATLAAVGVSPVTRRSVAEQNSYQGIPAIIVLLSQVEVRLQHQDLHHHLDLRLHLREQAFHLHLQCTFGRAVRTFSILAHLNMASEG